MTTRRKGFITLILLYGAVITASIVCVVYKPIWLLVIITWIMHVIVLFWIAATVRFFMESLPEASTANSNAEALKVNFRTDELTAQELYHVRQWQETRKPEFLIAFLNLRAPDQAGKFDNLPMSQLESLFNIGLKYCQNYQNYVILSNDTNDINWELPPQN